MFSIPSFLLLQAPATRQDGQHEQFAQEAQYFTESRLLQRDVEVVLESVNNKNFVGSIIHPNGNIAEALLREGFAKCVDWSLKCVTGGPEKYRQAQVRMNVLASAFFIAVCVISGGEKWPFSFRLCRTLNCYCELPLLPHYC